MPVAANPLTLILRNRRERMQIDVLNSETDVAVTPESLRLTVTDLADNTLHVDAVPSLTLTGTLAVTSGSTLVTGTGTRFTTELTAGDTFTLGGTTYTVSRITGSTTLELATAASTTTSGAAVRPSRIQNPVAGSYYIEWGDEAAPANSGTSGQTETNQVGTRLFIWEVEDQANDLSVVVQQARIVSGRTLSLLPGFRKLIDKAVKLVDEPDECFLGYTDAHLIQYLEEGLTLINAYEPYPCFSSLDHYPLEYLHILHESSLVAGVLSQTLFAIDTDMPNYSDQGNSFVIDHGTKLAALLNTISTRMDKLIPMMKLKFVSTGSLHVQAGTNFRLTQLLQAAPNGAVFRNLFFRGS